MKTVVVIGKRMNGKTSQRIDWRAWAKMQERRAERKGLAK